MTLTDSDDVIVCDVGADSVRVVSRSGAVVLELDTHPLDQPTCALAVTLSLERDSNFHGYLVACRTSLKLFDARGRAADVTLSSDVKCPSYLAKDRSGNILVCDMLDSGSAIVTLDRRTLAPLNIFLGVTSLSMLHADAISSTVSDPACFSSAWYLCVTRAGDIVLSDREQHAVKAYSASGEHLWTFSACGSLHGNLFNPAGLSEDRFGHILVADNGHDRVLMLSSDGECLGLVVSHRDDVTSPVDVMFNSKLELVVLLANGIVKIFQYLKENSYPQKYIA